MKIESPNRELFPEEIIAKAHQKAKVFFQKYSINQNTFADLYGEDKIKVDESLVNDLEEKFELANAGSHIIKERKIEAEIAEAIIGDQGEMSNWLGENVELFKTTKFDDYINGVDLVAEYELGEMAKSHLGLAVDVVMSDSAEKIGDKIENIKLGINQGRSGIVKYFLSGDNNFKGSLRNIPKVVIGISRETTQELAKLWIQETKETKNALAEHWIQFQILGAILIQLESFKDYAEKVGQKEIAQNYEKVGIILSRVLKERKEIVKDSGERDEFFSTLKHYLPKILGD